MDQRKNTPVMEQPDTRRLSTADVAAAAQQKERHQLDRPDSNEQNAALFGAEDLTRYREQWRAVQAGFVDSPRTAVEHADSLVAEIVKRLAEMFAVERNGLEKQWDRDGDVSTEDLRIALQRYRSFFNRLLSV
jgi:hypothetical protein